MARHDDPFRPPEDSGHAPLELAPAPERRPAPEQTVPPIVPSSPEPVVHARLPGGAGNLVLWGFAALGVLAIVGAGAYFLRRGVQVTAAAAPAAEEPKPVTWKEVGTGNAVLVTVEVKPRNARLLLDGTPLPSNPVRLARGSTHRIGAMADGYAASAVEVTADEEKTVTIALEREGTGRR